ncbi:SPL family radical SAM protein [Desulfotalea psychrophila]|uniref:Related to DNA repair photolyase n=1 Tax=Desulfotalea psychrophila (strain LSv54 / DSM 12343) TaxID=177439 RepID=Q6ALC1_DESPS|nr:radical SAM protein [Desulfotalea psychrophila]CAG36854.1 related to DNA repair photolyase [Desulfotalea psychrophila LSv54]
MTSNKLSQNKLFHKLPAEQQQWLISMEQTYAFSFQQLKMMAEYSADLISWQTGSLAQFHHPHAVGGAKGKQASAKVFHQLRDGYESLKNGQKSYSEEKRFAASEQKFPEEQMVEVQLKGSIMGECPVASEKTRCCKLKTLDVVQQCGFDCSYCSIQSFYHGNQVRFIRDLVSHLNSLELDPTKGYHIGTGQSSDSLMWGNRFGLLDSLYQFATEHPNVVLEMKSKSARIDYFLENTPPSNMVFTWSLNTPTVIQHEEKATASLDKRLESARKLADQGIPVGFHLHPITWYQGWQEDYRALVSRLVNTFQPEEVVMVSLGTLTFIKPVLKRIRERMPNSSILQMPMEDCAGKLSYPFDIKKELFSTISQAFPASWHDSVFFYMCMEHIDLWQPVFGRSYDNNEQFEEDMLRTYQEKISQISQSR